MGKYAGILAAMCGAVMVSWLAAAPQTGPTDPGLASSTKSIEEIDVLWPPELAADTALLVIGSLESAGNSINLTISPKPATKSRGQKLAELDLKSHAVRHRTPAIQLASWSADDRELSASIEVQTEYAQTSRVFFIQTRPEAYLPGSFQPVSTRLAAESDHIRLWDEVDPANPRSPEFYAWLLDCWEAVVLPELTVLFGEIKDVDGDGKLSICLTTRLAELPRNGSPVEGLTQSHDFQRELPRPFSNQADVLFLSRDLQPSPQAAAVLAHEAAHLAVFSRRYELDPNGFSPEDDWLNEGLAHFAEVQCTGSRTNLADRIAAFEGNSATSPLVVVDAQRQGFWRDPGSRGAAWSFLNWLAEIHGPELMTRFATHPEVGCRKIEAVLQQPFSEIFRHWSVAMSCRGKYAFEAVEAPSQSLCGSSQMSIKLTRSAAGGFSVAIPAGRAVQITLVDPQTEPPRAWIVR